MASIKTFKPHTFYEKRLNSPGLPNPVIYSDSHSVPYNLLDGSLEPVSGNYFSIENPSKYLETLKHHVSLGAENLSPIASALENKLSSLSSPSSCDNPQTTPSSLTLSSFLGSLLSPLLGYYSKRKAQFEANLSGYYTEKKVQIQEKLASLEDKYNHGLISEPDYARLKHYHHSALNQTIKKISPVSAPCEADQKKNSSSQPNYGLPPFSTPPVSAQVELPNNKIADMTPPPDDLADEI